MLRLFLAFTVFLTVLNALSTSEHDGPLIHFSFVSSPKVTLLPRLTTPDLSEGRKQAHMDSPLLHHSDHFRLSFMAFNQSFHLHLRPNWALLHPQAKVIYHDSASGSDNTTSQATRDLKSQDNWLYRGVVMMDSHSQQRYEKDKKQLLETLPDGVEEEDHDFEHHPGVLGWARVIVHHDIGEPSHKNPERLVFEGAFTINDELFHVKYDDHFDVVKRPDDPVLPNPSARDFSERSSRLVIYRDADKKVFDPKRQIWKTMKLQLQSGRCGGAGKILNPAPTTNVFEDPNSPLLSKVRLSRRASVPIGCPANKMIIYMGVAADCTYVGNYNSQDAARKQILQDWNSASAVYERTFNVQLGVILIDIRQTVCPSPADSVWNRGCSDQYTINQRLSDFSRWRGTKGNDGAGLWHLVTKCGTGPKIGVAWLKSLCQYTATAQPSDSGGGTDYVSGTGVSSIVKDTWKVIAHEIGHGFGAQHDCTSDFCPCRGNCGCCPCDDNCDCNQMYLMNPTADVKTGDFSPCSIRDICANYPALGTCLARSPGKIPVMSIAMCGNGLKEKGEECDCGTPEECANDTCCDATTCKLKGAAKCDDKNDLCCENCQLKAANTTCRTSSSICDIPEICNGVSPDCPPDSYVKDGTKCSSQDPELKCASGFCTSRTKQCLTRVNAMINFTKACPPSKVGGTCFITCQDKSETCYMLSGVFVDGTECGNGGFCKAGTCEGDSIFNGLGTYLISNPWLPIAFGAIVMCCCFSCCFQYIRQKRAEKAYLDSIAARRAAGADLNAYTNMQRPVGAPYQSNQQYEMYGRPIMPAGYPGGGTNAPQNGSKPY